MRLKKTRMSEEAATEGSATIDSTHAPSNNAAESPGRDSRQALAVERFDNGGGLPARGPGGANRRPLREAGFVQKTEPSLQFLSVFFTRGQGPRTHRRMALSLRSRARRSGRWRLQPSWPSTRHTWGTE